MYIVKIEVVKQSRQRLQNVTQNPQKGGCPKKRLLTSTLFVPNSAVQVAELAYIEVLSAPAPMAVPRKSGPEDRDIFRAN